MLTDTHCHLDFNNYDKDRNNVLERAWNSGIGRILNPGIDVTSSQAAIQIARTDDRIFSAVGVHPNSATTWNSQSYHRIKNLAENPEVVAVGEIGLDYYRDRAPRDLQREIFLEQLELARSLKLPVIIHTRNTSLEDRKCISDVIGILKEWNSELIHPGVVHSYSGDEKEAEHLLSLGFMIGITGPATYKNADILRRVIGLSPLELMLIETDGPFLTPHPYRGKRNEPSYVRFIAQKIGEIKGIPLERVAAQTTINAGKMFKWGNGDRTKQL